MRIAHRLIAATAFALTLSGCTFSVAPQSVPGPMTGIPWSVLANPGGDRCRNYRNYHTDCRRRHDDSGDATKGGNTDQGNGTHQDGGDEAPAEQSGSAQR